VIAYDLFRRISKTAQALDHTGGRRSGWKVIRLQTGGVRMEGGALKPKTACCVSGQAQSRLNEFAFQPRREIPEESERSNNSRKLPNALILPLSNFIDPIAAHHRWRGGGRSPRCVQRLRSHRGFNTFHSPYALSSALVASSSRETRKPIKRTSSAQSRPRWPPDNCSPIRQWGMEVRRRSFA